MIKPRRKLTPMLLLVCWACGSLLQHPAHAAPTSRPAKEVEIGPGKAHPAFAKVSARLTRTKVLRASFRQVKRLKALRFPLRSQGTFLFASAKGIAWHLTKPFPATFVMTHDLLLQRANGKTTRHKAQQKPLILGFTRMFLAVFGGDPRQLHRHFRVFFQGSAQAWQLGLIPKHPLLRRIFRRITLQGKRTIEQVKMAERSGDHTTLTFSKIQTTPLTPQEARQFPK